MNIARKVFCLLLLLWATSDDALAFKPSTEEYGHTMITKSLLSAGGYSFGAGNVVPQFTVGNVAFTPTAVEQIVLGAQSRDWSGVDGLNCYGGLNALTSVLSVACFTGRDGDYKDIVITGDLALADAHFDADNFAGSADAIHRLIRGSVNWEGVYYYGFAGSQFPVSYPGQSVIDLLKRYVSEVAVNGAPTLAQRQMLMVARIKLGKALHTLQDFYAHSTWADIYGADKIFLPVTDNLVNAVSKPNFSGFTLASAHSHADEGWNGDVCKARDPADAPTWAENGGNWEWQTLPAVTSLGVISSSAWDLLTAVTTGAASDKLGYSRCDHGSDSPKTVSGIAKDAPYMPFDSATHCTAENSCIVLGLSGHYTGGRATAALKSTPSHLVASQQAALHSVELLNKLIYIIRNDATIAATPAQAERMVSELLGATEPVPRIAFVVDASGSMSNIIPGISTGLGIGANTSGKSLITYDAAGTQTLVSENVGQMQTLLASAGNGGTGCETPALSVLLKVVNELPAYSSVYLFTDAGASDADQLSAVGAAAVARNIRINPVVFGGCGLDAGAAGPVTASTKVYAELRNRTGGRSYSGLPDQAPAQTLFAALLAYEAILNQAGPRQSAALGRSRATSAAAITTTTSATTPGILLVESGALAQARTVSFPVDGGLSQLIVTVSAVGAQVSLFDPSGQAVALTDNGGGMVYTSVPNPTAGSWNLAMTATVQVPYSAQVDVRGGVLLKDLQYESLVEIGTRSGHEYAPSLGSTPTSGASMAKVQIDGATGTSVTLSYVSESGAVISSYPLTLVSPTVFMGKVTVPTSAYWVKVTGQGQEGSSFTRMWRGEHPLPEPTPGGRVAVQGQASAAWVPGQTGRASVSLTNLGADEVLTLSARSNFGTVAVTPKSVTLAANSRASAELSVLVPPNASAGSSAGLVLTITRVGGTSEIEIPITIRAAPLAGSALTVSRAGAGAGTVTSTPAGITCGSTCSGSFNTGTIVTLTATPAAGSTFSGWSGACSGTGTCTVSMDAARGVTATFSGSVSVPGDMVAHYCFDDASNLGKDCSTRGNNGTPSGGVAAAAGVVGGGAKFNGVSNPGVIRVPNSASLQFGTTMSLSYFVKIDSSTGMNGYGSTVTGDSVHAVVAKSHDATGMAWIVYAGSSNELSAGYAAFSGIAWTDGTSVVNGWASGFLGRWVHVVSVFDSVGVKTYMDGRLAQSASGAVNFGVTNTQDMFIGKYSYYWYPLNGTLDDLRVYNRALSAAEVQALASLGSASCASTLSASSAVVIAGASTGNSVSVASTCAWTATSNVSWVTIASGSAGGGNGNVTYSVAANTSTTTRTGTLTIAGKTYTVTQAGASVSPPVCTLSASSASIASGASSTLMATCSPSATTYVWTGGSCVGTTGTTCTVTPTATTTYTVAGVNKDGTGAAASATVTVTGTPPTPATKTYTDNGDGTVTDPTTGLTWMRCAMGQTWSGNTCAGTAGTYTWDQANALTGTTAFAGKGDWRLPNIRELQTIVDRTRYGPAIDLAAFPGTPRSNFWSGSPYSFRSDWSRNVYFDDGYAGGANRNDGEVVRLVRGGQSLGLLNIARPTTDYVDHGDGTVTHMPTNLMWQRCAVGTTWTGSGCGGAAARFTWDAAKVLSSSFAGKTDWRLPSIEELLSIVDYTNNISAINLSVFPSAPSLDFWSGTPRANDSGYAWGVYFVSNGGANDYPRSNYDAVRLVRGQQFTTPVTAPVCKLVANPVVTSAGKSATLSANCTPAASSYTWTNSGFASTASGGMVSPIAPTVYSVVGSNAGGSSSPASAAVYVCNTPPSQNYTGLSLVGSAANETMTSGIASDTIDGGPGFDTVIYNCNRDSFTLTKTTSGWKISSAAEGIDTITNVERITFGDRTLALDISGNAGQAYRIYQAAFNRVPDNGGLKFWIASMDGGATLRDVAIGFVGSPEFQSVYGSNPTNEQFVVKLYNNVLHRDPDAGGKAYWLDLMNRGLLDKVGVLMQFSESPENQAGVLNAIINGIDLLN